MSLVGKTRPRRLHRLTSFSIVTERVGAACDSRAFSTDKELPPRNLIATAGLDDPVPAQPSLIILAVTRPPVTISRIATVPGTSTRLCGSVALPGFTTSVDP